MSWETIEKSWSIKALDDLSQVKGKGSGFMRFIVKTFGKRNAYNGSIVIIFIFPLACFVLWKLKEKSNEKHTPHDMPDSIYSAEFGSN